MVPNKNSKTKIIKELKSLIHSFELVNSTIDFHKVLDNLMQTAKNITNSEAASVLLVEDDKLSFIAASGDKKSEIKKIYLNKDEGIAGWVIKNKKPVIVNDASKDKRFAKEVDNESGFTSKNLLAVPLKIEGKVIGVVEAVNKKRNKSFTKDDARMLFSLSSTAALAVHKARLYRDLKELFLSTITAIVNAIEAKDPYTRGHSERIRDFSMAIARNMNLPDDIIKVVEISALLHDVGKIGVPEAILCKKDKLKESEFALIKKHPSIGADMLSSIKQLKEEIPGILYHQERYDGKGYPSGLKGKHIPLVARIIAVADTFDAMTSSRPYRNAMSDDVSINEIKTNSKIQFDSQCVRGFINAYRKGEIRKR